MTRGTLAFVNLDAAKIEIAESLCVRLVSAGVIRSAEVPVYLGTAWEIVEELSRRFDSKYGTRLGQYIGRVAYFRFRETVLRERGVHRSHATKGRFGPPPVFVPLPEVLGVPAAGGGPGYVWEDVKLLKLPPRVTAVLERLRAVGSHKRVAKELGLARCTVTNVVRTAREAARKEA